MSQYKGITLNTNILAAQTNLLLSENEPMDAENLPEDLDSETRDRLVTDVPKDELLSAVYSE